MNLTGLLAFLAAYLLLILVSAFFSSAETSLLTASRVKLAHRAKKKDRKALLLTRLMEKPEEFLSTILIGNNLGNVAAASLATYLFTRFFPGKESTLLLSTLMTTLVLLIFGEITPKSYGYRHAERLSYLYVYPIRFFTFLFYPLVKGLSLLPRLFFRGGKAKAWARRELSLEEIKHFLSMESQLFQQNPDTLKMLTEIIDISQKEIKAIMTPRVAIVALEESGGARELRSIILEKKYSKIPVYRGKIDNIVGVIDSYQLLAALLQDGFERLDLKKITARPIFVSEYSSLNYILKEFKKHRLNLAVVLDEYGSIIGIITLSDILRSVLGDIDIGSRNIHKLGANVFQLKGSTPVAEINSRLALDLPERKDYTTISGLFIYEYGKMPQENARVKIKQHLLVAKKMGKRKIEEIILTGHEDPRPE
ncbi:MAG: HlyC/CorC family transporter [Candidatus Aminicenantes bacterium]|nr:HlyC/CorC family transporter [Candidatus Aminicenantes bacterium]